jgi:hypothetical protein
VRQKRHEFSGKSQVFFSSREEEEEVGVEGEVGGGRDLIARAVFLFHGGTNLSDYGRGGARDAQFAQFAITEHIFILRAQLARANIFDVLC